MKLIDSIKRNIKIKLKHDINDNLIFLLIVIIALINNFFKFNYFKSIYKFGYKRSNSYSIIYI